MKLKLTGHPSSQRHYKEQRSKIFFQTSDQPQLVVPQLKQLLKLLQQKKSQVRIFFVFPILTKFSLEKEEKKEEEADVDMGNLFGDEY